MNIMKRSLLCATTQCQVGGAAFLPYKNVRQECRTSYRKQWNNTLVL